MVRLAPEDQLGVRIDRLRRQIERRDVAREVLERGIEQLVLGLEVPEQRDFVDTGLLRDAPGGGAAHAGVGVHGDGGLQKRLTDVHTDFPPYPRPAQNASDYLLTFHHRQGQLVITTCN